MSNPEKNPSVKPAKSPAQSSSNSPSSPPPAGVDDRGLFRPIDWAAFALTTLLVFVGYFLTISPQVTLEDSGELAVGSMYAGVPHPPGYPVWTLYTWLFTKLLPFSNIAWRVSVATSVAGAVACGLIALMVSRGSSMMIESIGELKTMDRRWENAACLISGYVAGMLIGFNGFMWSQAVIVEVYPLSVLSLTGVMMCLLKFMHQPDRKRYLYLCFFLFGICFTNHQTLLVAAMGIEVAILARKPSLGRDMLLGNSIVYLIGLVLKSKGSLTSFDNNPPLFMIYNMVGLSSIIGCAWLAATTQALGKNWKPIIIMGALFILGSAFYLYMPLASMTNPPMNWGYARTVEGFFHALTRGQYERANPVNILKDPMRFVGQLRMYTEGAIEEFNFVYLLIGLLPFVFFRRMQPREKAWIAGLTGIFACLAILLLMLLNPQPDRQSKELNRVFFTASHVVIAMGIGYGLTLIGAVLQTHYERYRRWALGGAAIAAGLALYGHASLESQMPQARYAMWFGLILACSAALMFLVCRTRIPMPALLGMFFVMPTYSILTHWSDNEQRNHLFGYWFGHDMFRPPFQDKSKKPLYPDMTKDAVLFGGTDPGRFNPTYMIFCESFTEPRNKPLDPTFDRRDVYLITQNALADNTYLNYIRAHYNRSAQKDPPFFQELVKSERQRLRGDATPLSRMVAPLDTFFIGLGERIEKDRRAKGVYPPREIITPTIEDSNKAFNEYIADAQRRLQLNQLRPGEDVRVVDNRVQVSGQVAVMAINGLLTKVIFDRNPDHEFFVEESFPLDWMYPYLTPFGIIMKINRQPQPDLSDEVVRRDHEFWTQYSERLTGNFIKYETPVKEICEFAERVYIRRDFKGFTGDRAFIRDDNAQKAFSKLRSSQAGLYRWRVNNAHNPIDQQRMIKEADFAFRQAIAFCPYSPEAVYRYVDLLATLNRVEDALMIAETCVKFDADNAAIQNLVQTLRNMKQNQGSAQQATQQIDTAEKAFKSNPTNFQAGVALVEGYLQSQKTPNALGILDVMMQRPEIEAGTLLYVAQKYAQLGQAPRLEATLLRLVKALPQNAEAWYDLAAVQATLGRSNEAVVNLARSIDLSNERIKKEPGSKDLNAEAGKDQRLASLRGMPGFDRLVKAPAQ